LSLALSKYPTEKNSFFIHNVLTLRDEKYGVQIPKGVEEFLFFTTIQSGPVAHPALHSMGILVLPQG